MNAIVDYTSETEKPTPITLEDWKTHQEKVISVIYPAVSERIKLLSADMRKRLDEHRKVLETDPYPKGTIVMIKDVSYANNPGLKPKTEPKYVGPYTVVRRTRNGAYQLQDTDGNFLDRLVSIDHIKKTSPKLEMSTIYQVEDILDHRDDDGEREFLTKWHGYDDPTWVEEKNFLDTQVIQNYWKKKRPATSSRSKTKVSVTRQTSPPSTTEDLTQQDERDTPVAPSSSTDKPSQVVSQTYRSWRYNKRQQSTH
jgi:hypothetical protein